MKTNPNSQALVELYMEVLQQPLSKRYNLKQLIFDLVPAKRLLYQVFMPEMRIYEHPVTEQLGQLSAHDLRFINFLESTDFTIEQREQIFKTHADLREAIPEKYQWRIPTESRAFAFYGRKFGRQPILSGPELDSLYNRN